MLFKFLRKAGFQMSSLTFTHVKNIFYGMDSDNFPTYFELFCCVEHNFIARSIYFSAKFAIFLDTVCVLLNVRCGRGGAMEVTVGAKFKDGLREA